MGSDSPPISLLSYLDAGKANFSLDFTQIPRQAAGDEAAFQLFLRVGNSGPTAWVTSAKIITGSGDLIKKVFFLQQMDEYRIHADEIWPLNNIDIDQHWQAAIARISDADTIKSLDNGPVLLKDQVDDAKRLRRFQALFYCIFRKVYFHPPCPNCGHELSLCEDDQLLINSELKAYSTSLSRYLYCVRCNRESGHPGFYTYKREPSDPPHLKDQGQLISDFSQLVLNTAVAGHFPCTTCQEKSNCYGPDNLMRQRIVPFEFYPFYGFIFESATLHAIDFLKLLSGATPDELRGHLLQERELGRLSLLDAYSSQDAGPPSCLFAPDHPKRFLEILYLKLSFLGELVKMVSAESDPRIGFDAPFTVDDLWVTLPDHSHRLPSFWNFKLNMMDLGMHAGSSGSMSKYPPAYTHHLLGVLWFYVLLVNKRQAMDTVQAEIEQAVTALSEPGQPFSEASGTTHRPVLVPENIYRDPEGRSIEAGWETFLKQSMDLGGELLAAGRTQSITGSDSQVWLALESLRKEIMDSLLDRPVLHEPTKTMTNDPAIAAIILELRDKWRSSPRSTTDARDPDETIAVSGDEKADLGTEPLASHPEEGSATVIISPGKAAGGKHRLKCRYLGRQI